MKVEFHVHTIYSKDSMLTWPFILLMCKIKKIKAIAITDHNEIKGAIKYKRILSKYGIIVIVGEEIFTSDGEIIGLFLKKKIEPNLTAKETVIEIKKQNGLVYIPHPYDEKRAKTVINELALRGIASDVDFIEIHNGRNIKSSFSKEQEKIAEKLHLRKVVGSDAHTFYELGRNYCILNSFEKKDLLSENILDSYYEKKCLSIAHFNTKIVRGLKMLKRGDVNGIFRGIYRKFRRGNKKIT